jgi:hypothetical protein
MNLRFQTIRICKSCWLGMTPAGGTLLLNSLVILSEKLEKLGLTLTDGKVQYVEP